MITSWTDWEKIEADYRAGIKSLRQIGTEYGISHVAVDKRAKKEAWPRDLSAKIKAKAADMVNRGVVNGGLTKATETDVVSSNATLQATIQLSHRKDIAALRKRATEYELELSECADDLGKRASILKSLADTQKSLIGLERQAFGIDDRAGIGEDVTTIEIVGVRRAV
jgi:hypothetical protein